MSCRSKSEGHAGAGGSISDAVEEEVRDCFVRVSTFGASRGVGLCDAM